VIGIGISVVIDAGRKKNAQKRIKSKNVVYLDNNTDEDVNLHDTIGKYDTIFDDTTIFTNIINKTLDTFRNSNYKTVYNLFFIEQNKMEEISVELNIPINSVKTIIYQLRKKLAPSLVQFV